MKQPYIYKILTRTLDFMECELNNNIPPSIFVMFLIITYRVNLLSIKGKIYYKLFKAQCHNMMENFHIHI